MHWLKSIFGYLTGDVLEIAESFLDHFFIELKIKLFELILLLWKNLLH
jgi:hypothetical protein